MIKNKVPLLILLLFGDLFASCFYDDADKTVHLKDTIVDCYKIIISYNPPVQSCGGLNYGIGLEKKKNCNSFEKKMPCWLYTILLKNIHQTMIKQSCFI